MARLLGIGCAAASAFGAWADSNCFVLRHEPLEEPPFSNAAVAHMRDHFLANLNQAGNGAVVASPGAIPALMTYGFPMYSYRYDWMRDGALSMIALQRLLDSEVGRVGVMAEFTEAKVDEILRAYAGRVQRIVAKDGETMYAQGQPRIIDSHGEPKWTLKSNRPFTGHWCKPQTDGAGLRAKALMIFANRTHFSTAIADDYKEQLWGLIKFDLDWLAQGSVIGMASCDLWEDTMDRNFLWNRMVMRAALLMGHHFAYGMKDHQRAHHYLYIVEHVIGNPIEAHKKPVQTAPHGVFVTGCASNGGLHQPCVDRGIDTDGAVILALIHSGWMDLPKLKGAPLFPASSPIASAVANTVRVQTERFCEAFPINRQDSSNGLPGVLYGRAATDSYGGGNPWLLITAALASLFYQAAQAVAAGASVSDEQVEAWRAALGTQHFHGFAKEFIAAGDSVLMRLRKHIGSPTLHLWEQIDKVTGKQLNAKDLSWSYAEVLSALRERAIAKRLHSAQVAKDEASMEKQMFV